MMGSPRIAGVALVAIATASVATAQFPEGKIASYSRITTSTGGFGGVLSAGDRFGAATAGIGDLDGNGTPDVVAGAPGEDDGGSNRGGAWILFLNASGTVIDEQKISDTAGSFGGTLANSDALGSAVANVGDLDGDGRNEIAVGTVSNKFFVLFLDTDGTVISDVEIAAATGGFSGALDAGDGFGSALTCVGDVNSDGIPDIAAGAPGDDDGGSNRGAAWILFMNANGTVASQQKISATMGSFGTGLANGDAFGTAVAGLSDYDGNGVHELAVGAPLTNGFDLVSPGLGMPPVPVAAADEGVFFVLFLDTNGSVLSKVEIGEELGGFSARPDAGDHFGATLTALGDINGNGVTDVSVGSPERPTGIGPVGGFYQVFMEDDGTVERSQLITQSVGGFSCGFQCLLLLPGDTFASVGYLGDVDGDCIGDMVCGAPGDDAAGNEAGVVWLLILKGDEQAETNFRNGTGVNTVAYSANRPRLGHAWEASIDTSGHAGATLTFIIGLGLPGTLGSPFGEILVDLGSGEVFSDVAIGAGGQHVLGIPMSTSLLGLAIATQGGIGGGAGVELVNALDLKLGY